MATKKTPKTEICAAHGELINLLMEAQKLCAEQSTMIGYHTAAFEKIFNTQEEHGEKLNGIQRIVTNGLQSDIKEIKDSMKGFKIDLQGFMETTREKIVDFEGFNWFRKPMNKFKDSLIWKIIWLIFIACVVVLAMHFDTVVNLFMRAK